MLVVTAMDTLDTIPRPAVFLGGAITGAADWQREAIELLRPAFAACFNPRRPEGFCAPDQPDYVASYRAQTQWEHRYILAVDVVLFWMPCDALAVTTRFEIGWCFGMHTCAAEQPRRRVLAVGIEPGARGDIYYRVVLPDHGIPVHTTLEATCAYAREQVAVLPR